MTFLEHCQLIGDGVKMCKNEPIQISSLTEFIDWVNELGSDRYLFRGVPNADYRLQASAYRRPKEEDRNFERFLQINKNLIADTRLRGHGEKDGRELGDLEILAELQHFGAATCLIDFTHNAQIALYFACQKDLKWEKNSQDSNNPPDGKVYAVHNDPLRMKKVTPDLLKEKIDFFLPSYQRKRQLYHWEPGHQNNRIIAQQSIFVFGTDELFGLYEIDTSEVCIIQNNCKEDILNELENASGITQNFLFPDFDGFARLHGEEIPYTEPSASDYFNHAAQAYGSARYEEAILYYNKAIELDPNDSELYIWRSYVNQALEQHNAVIDDLTKVIEIENSTRSYEMRAKIWLGMKQYQKAFADYDKAIELQPDISYGYYNRAEAKFELAQYPEAITDFDKVLQIDPTDIRTYILRGKAKELIGDIEGQKQILRKH